MGVPQERFAKPLPKAYRFLTAVKMTTVKFRPTKPTDIMSVFISLSEDIKDMPKTKIEALSRFYFRRRVDGLKEFFLDRYNDEDGMVDYLNKEISIKYFTKDKTKKDKSRVDASVKKILSENLATFLGKELE